MLVARSGSRQGAEIMLLQIFRYTIWSKYYNPAVARLFQSEQPQYAPITEYIKTNQYDTSEKEKEIETEVVNDD